jgi:hypothetical protein
VHITSHVTLVTGPRELLCSTEWTDSYLWRKSPNLRMYTTALGGSKEPLQAVRWTEHTVSKC